MPQRLKPVELHVLNGNPSKKKLPAVPKRPPLAIDPPAELGRIGKAYWRRLIRDLGPAAIAQITDREAMLRLCQTWEISQSAYRDLRAATPGTAEWRQQWMAYRDCGKDLLALWGRFGLTPSDRGRLATDVKEARQDGIASLLEEAPARSR